MLPDEITLINKLLKELKLEHLSCDMLYLRSYKTILAILKLEEWQNPIFKPLLTSTIWQSKPGNVKKILEFKEWQNPIFKPLLTSNIWHSTPDNVKAILDLEEWQNPIFKPLLTSNIWHSTPDNRPVR